MLITKLYGLSEAATARGHVVVIDVLRAFTTAAYAFGAGAEEIFLVGTPEEAFFLKREFPDALLVGEQRGVKIEGFDLGNSPEEISKLSLNGQRVILRSSSGTQGVVHAQYADKILLGSLVVASATADYLQGELPNETSLVAMGGGAWDGPEDVACREYMAALMSKEPVNKAQTIQEVRESRGGKMAIDPTVDWISPGDLECAVAIDKFDFAMPVERRGNLLVARRAPAGERVSFTLRGSS